MPANKPTLVFLHGAGGSALLWNYQTVYFDRQGYQVLAIDFPGHGRRPGPSLNRVGDYAEFVQNELVDKGVQQPIVIGHSLGGAVALTLALRSPQSYAGLVLVGTGARLKVLPTIFDLIKTVLDDAYEWLTKTSYSTILSPRDLKRTTDILRKNSPDVLLNDFEACDHFDVIGELGTVATPTLIVVGSEDRLTPVKYSEFLRAHIEGSLFHIIESAGHMVMVEQPHEFNAVLEQFLNGLPGPFGHSEK